MSYVVILVYASIKMSEPKNKTIDEALLSRLQELQIEQNHILGQLNSHAEPELKEGDQVRIVNPNAGEEPTGKVINTGKAFVTVQLSSERIVRRKYKNVCKTGTHEKTKTTGTTKTKTRTSQQRQDHT